MTSRTRFGVGVAVLAALVAGSASPAAAADTPGAVYALGNSAAGNAVLVYDRAADGSLTPAGAYATGGLGSGNGLGSQGAIVVSDDGRTVYAVDAGSDSVAAFAVRPNGLELIDSAPSGGDRPVSVAVRKDLLYVLHAGAPNSIAALRVGPSGDLSPIAGSARPLSAASVTPSQIGFTPDGGVLVVTERATNRITTFVLDAYGYASSPHVYSSTGVAPFGFAFDNGGTLVVSNAGGDSGASSYVVGADGAVTPVTTLASGRRAACWIAISKNGRYAYATNGGTADVTGFAIDGSGAISLLDPSGVNGTTTGGATDSAFSESSSFLYVRTGGGLIEGFRANADGSLEKLPGAAALPAGAAGLAAR